MRKSKMVAMVMAVSMIMGIGVVPVKAEVVSSLDTAEETFFGTTSGTSDASSDTFFDNANQNGASAPDSNNGGSTGKPSTDTPTTSTPATSTPATDTPATSTPATSTPAMSTTETTNSNNTYYYYYTTPTTAPTTNTSTTSDKSENITLNGTQNPISQVTSGSSNGNVALKQPQIATVVGKRHAVLVAVRRAIKNADGYQVQICKSKHFKNGITQFRTVLTTKTAAVRGSGNRYVRVRAYKIVNGKNVYSAWSPVKAVKINK